MRSPKLHLVIKKMRSPGLSACWRVLVARPKHLNPGRWLGRPISYHCPILIFSGPLMKLCHRKTAAKFPRLRSRELNSCWKQFKNFRKPMRSPGGTSSGLPLLRKRLPEALRPSPVRGPFLHRPCCLPLHRREFRRCCWNPLFS